MYKKLAVSHVSHGLVIHSIPFVIMCLKGNFGPVLPIPLKNLEHFHPECTT